MENQIEVQVQQQQQANNTTQERGNTQQVYHVSEAELNAGMDFLRAAGFDPTTIKQDANNGAGMAKPSDIAATIKAMGKDIANKMDEFGQRLASLESRSAGSRADHHSFDTSTPTSTPEVRKDGCSTPVPNQQSALWADQPLNEVPD